jgi:hypothetical protein
MRLLTLLVVFAGKGEPLGYAEGFMSSKADGIVIPVPALDLPEDGELSAPCKTARFETVVFGRDRETVEAGRVFFPEIDSFLDVYTPRHGLVVELGDGREAGSITWHVRAGGGLFSAAKGIVTGNFTAKPDGTFVDHQLFKLILPR